MIKLISAIFLGISVLCGSFGTVFLKKGSKNLKISTLMHNWAFIIGNLLFLLSLLFYSIALKNEELSVAYPLTSLGYLLVAFLSSKYFNEKITNLKLGGIIFIILGVFLLIN